MSARPLSSETLANNLQPVAVNLVLTHAYCMEIDGTLQGKMTENHHHQRIFLLVKAVCSVEINGTLPKASLQHLARLGGQRIRIPAEFARHVGLNVTSRTDCWLVVMAEGRFRLLKQSDRPKEGYLGRLFEHLEEISEDESLDGTESNEYLALPARVIPCIVTPPRSGPRFNIPKEALALVVGDRSNVILRIVEGSLELWFPETQRQAMSRPIGEVLP